MLSIIKHIINRLEVLVGNSKVQMVHEDPDEIFDATTGQKTKVTQEVYWHTIKSRLRQLMQNFIPNFQEIMGKYLLTL